MMKEEEEHISTDTSACLSSEAQSIEVEFIKKYEQLPVLWDVKHPEYTNKYRRGIANDILAKILKKWDKTATQTTVRQKINILRACYRKDLRKHLASKTIGPDGEEIYEYNPKNWKFYALRFLGGKVDEDVEHFKNNNIVEVNVDNANYEDEDDSDSGHNGTASQVSDSLLTCSEDTTYNKRDTNKLRKKKKRKKIEVQDYFVVDSMLDREFDAIGSNVACKLKRMNSEQRCHAELLINKVLIQGLRNNLTDDTNLSEIYK